MKLKSVMRMLFRPKPPGPAELAHQLRDLLVFADPASEPRRHKRQEKLEELSKRMLEIRTLLYGGMDGSEPNPEACARFTREFFRDDTLRTLIMALPKLDLGFRHDASHVVANLQRQRVNSRILASDYLELNIDLLDILIKGYENNDIALTYGGIARQCIRHQTVAKYVLESCHLQKFFGYIQDPSYEVASDATATFKELLTRHKSTVAEFLAKNYDWFFDDFNSKLLLNENYITKRHATKLLGEILLDRSNTAVMLRYVSSLDNMKILMNLLKDPNKSIQIESFHIFKLFVANKTKRPAEIVNVLVSNKKKLLCLIQDFTLTKENKQFDADKAEVINEIISLKYEVDPINTIG